MRNVEVPQATDRTPLHFGRYELVQKLGAGGMADVYLAHQPGPFSAGKLIVIKRLRPGILDDGQLVQAFADESRIAVRLSHPNVVQTYEAVAEGQEFYLILEFLDGQSLFHVLARATRAEMPLALHLWILTQVLAGLHYAHELTEFDGSAMGIVHRDVSPSNVFVTYSGEVKLLDFGIAKSVGASTATREGIIKGKLGYAAPEQCLCGAIDRRTDLYAVGVMLWEAIAGRRRPMGETDASTYQARIQGTELRIDQAVANAPPALVSICNRALARQPQARYQTALEFRQALERYLQSLGFVQGAEQLQKFMHRHFDSDIDTMRRRLDEHLGRSRAMGTNTNTRTGQSRSIQSPTVTVTSEGSQPLELSAAKVTALPPKRRGLRLALPAGGVIALGLLWSLGNWNAKGPAPTPSAASVQHPASVANIPVAQPASPVTVSLASDPDRAELRLDGRQISNPYRAQHGRDGVRHHLTVALAGYETSDRDLLFDRDVDVTVTLTPQKQLATARVATRVPRGLPQRGARRADASPTTSPPAAESPQPGDNLTGRKKASRIDVTDPY